VQAPPFELNAATAYRHVVARKSSHWDPRTITEGLRRIAESDEIAFDGLVAQGDCIGARSERLATACLPRSG